MNRPSAVNVTPGDKGHSDDKNKGRIESPKHPSESEILPNPVNPPKPGSSVKTKTVVALNFACKHCSRVFTTNPGILKHLKCDHNITEEIPVLHYTSYMGKRRIKAKPVDNDPDRKSSENINGTDQISVSFACSICDKLFGSKDGAKRHLQTHHNVTHNIPQLIETQHKTTSERKPTPVFTPPLLPATSQIQISGPPLSFKAKRGEKSPVSQQPSTASGTPKCRPPKTGSEAEKSKKKMKSKTNFGLCKSIMNPVSSGRLKMEKFSLWDKATKPAVAEKTKQNEKPKESEKTQFAGKSYTEESLASEKPAANRLPPSTKVHQATEESPATDVPRTTEGLVASEDPPATDVPPTTEGLKASEDPPANDEPPVADSKRISRPREQIFTRKSTRRCETRDCVPCSVTVNCGECPNCTNKSLKQRCKKRQCPELNRRVKKAAEPRKELVPATPEFSITYGNSLPSEEVSDAADGSDDSGVGDIVNDIVSAAWTEVKMNLNKERQPKKKEKQFECTTCHTYFAHYASAKKHCKQRKGKCSICPLCGVKIAQAKNMSRHIKSTHHKPIEKTKKPVNEIPKCDECGISFSMMHKYKEHMRRKHQIEFNTDSNNEILHCPDCEFQNSSSSRMKAHWTIYHSEVKVIRCSLCEFECKSKSGILKHTQRIHRPEINSYALQSHSEPIAIPTQLYAIQTLSSIKPHGQPIQTPRPDMSLTPGPSYQTPQTQANSDRSNVVVQSPSWEEYVKFVNQQSDPSITVEEDSTYYNL